MPSNYIKINLHFTLSLPHILWKLSFARCVAPQVHTYLLLMHFTLSLLPPSLLATPESNWGGRTTPNCSFGSNWATPKLDGAGRAIPENQSGVAINFGGGRSTLRHLGWSGHHSQTPRGGSTTLGFLFSKFLFFHFFYYYFWVGDFFFFFLSWVKNGLKSRSSKTKYNFNFKNPPKQHFQT
jgi:hypothetical protein